LKEKKNNYNKKLKKIIKIKNIKREYFEKELNDHIDPDVTVAYGAASILD
jgi:molecular chaperone DnaK (HSP70)